MVNANGLGQWVYYGIHPYGDWQYNWVSTNTMPHEIPPLPEGAQP